MSGSGRSELGTRVVLSSLMLATIAGIYWCDAVWMAEHARRGVLTAAVLALVGLAGVHEYIVMMRKGGYTVAGVPLLVVSAVLFATAFLSSWVDLDRELFPLVATTLGLLFPLALTSLTKDRMERGLERQGATMLGFLLLAWPMFLAQGIALRHLPSVLFVVLVCKGGDIGAYLLGVAFGRHKLIPHISGGKTIEGSIGGVLTSVVLAVVLRGPLLGDEVEVGLTGAILLGIMLNVTTQTGDLIESLLKRRCGVKDSSALLPAHGGVLDLTDSLLFSFAAYFPVLIMLTEPSAS